ncbi:MAG TPA: nuclear transport factor 2 family protein [Steroidobacteraceae bacterium]
MTHMPAEDERVTRHLGCGESSMVKSLRIRRRSPALVLSVLLLAGGESASPADPPGPAATEGTPPSSSHGGFLSSLKQAFSQNVERDVVWAHFDVGSAPDTHRFYCLLDPKTGKREPNGVAGEPFQRPDGTTGLKGPAISPVSCSDAEQKGVLVTSGYAVKTGAGGASGSMAAPAPTPPAAPAAPAAASASATAAAPPAASAAVAAAAPAAASHAQGSDLRAQMEAANASFLAAYNTQNGAAFKGMYTPDAMLFAPSTQPLVGAEAIGAFWADRIKGGNRKNHTFEIVSVWADGRFAYQVARYTVDVVNDKGEIFKSVGNTVRIFERQADGKWLTKVHIFNSY